MSERIGKTTPIHGRKHKPFWERFEKVGDCWLYTGSRTKDGYGRYRKADGTTVAAHRQAWELTNGPIPEGRLACHKCDVRYPLGDLTYRRCGNPDHLFLGTHTDNHRDCMEKGRAFLGPPRLTEESREKIRRALAGRPKSPEQAARLRAMASHPNPSAETRSKIGAARKGRKHSAETVAKIKAALTGLKHSEATRAKNRAAARARMGQRRDGCGCFAHGRDVQ